MEIWEIADSFGRNRNLSPAGMALPDKENGNRERRNGYNNGVMQVGFGRDGKCIRLQAEFGRASCS